MIRFACPRCKSVLERPDNVAGTKFACPSCGQRLQVPLPPESKTVLGSLVGNDIAVAAPDSPAPLPAGDAQVRSVKGREHVFWNCPLCRSQVDIALDLGQTAVRCPHCSKKIAVPRAAAETVDAPSAPMIPFAPPFVTGSPNPAPPPPAAPRRPDTPELLPPPVTPRSRRRDREYDDDYDDDDFPSIERRAPRRSRYSREAAAKAASAGLVYSLISLALLVLTFVLWVLIAPNNRGRFGDREPLILVILLVVLGSFVLALLGIVFSSRGLDESNTYNRGQATAGLVCGIISLVIGSIVGLFFLCVGMIFSVGRF